MALLINLDLEGLEITSEYLKENLFYAAQEDFAPVHPFPKNDFRNAKEITERSQGSCRISNSLKLHNA